MNSLKYLLLLFCFSACSFFAQNGKKTTKNTFTVSGKIMQTSAYCGGVKPSEETLKNLSTPAPYSGKKLFVKKGNINSLTEPVVLSFSADENGSFSFSLPPGTYCILQEEQTKALKRGDYNAENISADENCLQKWWATPYYLLEVKDKNITIPDFSFHHACFINRDIPCLKYTGPRPQ